MMISLPLLLILLVSLCQTPAVAVFMPVPSPYLISVPNDVLVKMVTLDQKASCEA